jgi:lysophospholipase L1-like esterase
MVKWMAASAAAALFAASPALPAQPPAAAAAPDAAELTTLNQTLRDLVEKQDPSTKAIFDKYPDYQMIRAYRAPIAPANGARGARGNGAPAAAAPVATIPRDAGPWTPNSFKGINPSLPTLVVAGDSTAQTGDPGHRGWAALLVDYFDTSKINLVNPSIGGRSFRSFYYEGRWADVVAALKPGDIVMIQFGHNDGTGNGVTNPNGRPDLGGLGEETQDVTRADGKIETVHTFGWYARKYIQDVRDKGATPILMTTTVYNRWNNGVFARAGSNVELARQVAAQEKVLLLDDTAIISDHYAQMSQDAARPFFNADNLHTTTLGAIVNAEMFVAGMKALGVKPVVDALNEKGQAIAAYVPAAAPTPAPSTPAVPSATGAPASAAANGP